MTTKSAKHQRKSACIEQQINSAYGFYDCLQFLRAQNINPQYIVSHTGWGCGVFAKYIFPSSKLISYSEWWFNQDILSNSFTHHADHPSESIDGSRLDCSPKTYIRNATAALELSQADRIISPTQYQLNQLPSIFRTKTQVIHEGVDTSFFRPNLNWRSKNTFKITYATRGMEPLRGFPEFILALKNFLPLYPTAEAVILGEDRIAYGGVKDKPPKGHTWGTWAKHELAQFIQERRVTFLGFVDLTVYARVLKSSSLHVYLTRPFVPSWSILDSMASGCAVLSNFTEPTSELLHPNSTFWIPSLSVKDIFTGLSAAISVDTPQLIELGLSQRDHVALHWDRQHLLQKWLQILSIS